jgi:hypothetical protein
VLIILTILLSMCSVLMFLDDLHVHLFGLMKRNEIYVCMYACMHIHTHRIKQCNYKTSSIHTTQKFFTIFTRPYFWTLFTPAHSITLYSILVLSSHLHLGLPSDLYGERPSWESNICSATQDSFAFHNGILNFIVKFTISN